MLMSKKVYANLDEYLDWSEKLDNLRTPDEVVHGWAPKEEDYARMAKKPEKYIPLVSWLAQSASDAAVRKAANAFLEEHLVLTETETEE